MKKEKWRMHKTKLRPHFEYYSIDHFNTYKSKIIDDLIDTFGIQFTSKITRIMNARVEND